ncbi:hypothetical protein [Burkholderia cenocepacia]|uniref:hypothetical protein n=1 Tax=Burkholderia cenocepacia TaxID=95486 RepID=UPI00158B1C1F|nr:hypothetical protein [Burkholderia cenocepacia]
MRLPERDIDSIEEAIATLSNREWRELVVPMASVGVTSFCAEAALLQFVVTWARNYQGEAVATFSDLYNSAENFETSLQKHLGLPYVLAAWVLAGQLQSGDGSVLRRREAKGYGAFLDAMDNFQFHQTHETSEPRANLMCIQGSKREFIRPFYERDKAAWRVRPEGDIRVVIQDVLAHLADDWTAKYLREVSEPLAHLVRELVENSDWWARANHHGVEYDKGVRAVTLRLRQIDDDNAHMFAAGNTHVHSYLLQSLTTHPRVKKDEPPSTHKGPLRKLGFVEVTMVDSGPGLARRWLASRPEEKRSVDNLADIPLVEEENALIDCFKKWRTSSGNSLRGIGLFSIATLLMKRNGFLRIRTGRLAYLFGTQSAVTDIDTQLRTHDLSRDYVKLEDGTHVFLQDGKMMFFLRPWSQRELGPVEGTAYSILLPV